MQSEQILLPHNGYLRALKEFILDLIDIPWIWTIMNDINEFLELKQIRGLDDFDDEIEQFNQIL